MELSRPFCGTAAVAAGLVTPKELRGPRYRSLFRNVFLSADVPPSYLILCEAAALAQGALVVGPAPSSDEPVTALAGWAATEMLGADCAPQHATIDVLTTTGHRRPQPGLRVCHQQVSPGELVTGVPIPLPGRRPRFVPGRTVVVTSARRTAFDLARRVERTEAVIALDALSRVGRFAPAEVLDVAAQHPGARGARRLPGLVALATPLAQSPMETRVRLALHDGGVARPVLQYPVGRFFVDLGYPEVRLGVEYDGGHHRDPAQARDDLARQAFLTGQGWAILRPTAADVLRNPQAVADTVRYHLARLTR